MMRYVFQFCRILCFCLAGEVLAALLPFPVPASIYGLLLLLFALQSGRLKLGQVKDAGLFLTGIFPLLFVPAAAGVADLWMQVRDMILPILMALFPVTILVMAVSGRITQALAAKREGQRINE